jgi:hypothetical protein
MGVNAVVLKNSMTVREIVVVKFDQAMVLFSLKKLTAAAAHLAFTASIILRDVATPGSGDSKAGLVDKVRSCYISLIDAQNMDIDHSI